MAVDMKQMIAQTLTKRLEQKSVDKITVKELVEACGISRQAFYYHFQDIMDVIEWITSQALDASVDASLAAPTPQQAIKTVILSLRENGKLIQHLMASQRRPEIERWKRSCGPKQPGWLSRPAIWMPPSASTPMAWLGCLSKRCPAPSMPMRLPASCAACSLARSGAVRDRTDLLLFLP
mgnify:CR=1 FL=1